MSTTLTTEMPPLTYRGEVLEAEHLGVMTDCTPLLHDFDLVRRHMQEKGYVYLPGYLGRDRVREARRQFIEQFVEADVLDPKFDPMDGVLRKDTDPPGFDGGRLEQMFTNPRPVRDVLYAGPMMDFFRSFFSAPVLHYDFTWSRQVGPGPATPIHSDVVYMGRGTHELFTGWTPMGDNGYDLGGLMVLEGSNNHAGLAKAYWQDDVDAFCENKPDQRDGWAKGNGGALNGTAAQLRRSLGYDRWLTADYRMGDVVLFSIYTVHGGTDNTSNKVRLSTDTRYQRAGAAVDERWVGEDPPAHGPRAKKGLIC